MKTLFAACAALLFCSIHAADVKTPTVKPAPVPKEMLDGTRLILKNAECSLDLPGPGWTWMMLEKNDKIFMCMNAKLDLFVVSFSELKKDMTEHQPESLVKNARLTTEARGGKIVDDKYEMIEVPGTKKAAHLSFHETINGVTKYAYIYLLQTTDTVLLKVHITAADKLKEPPELKKIVDSIKGLKKDVAK